MQVTMTREIKVQISEVCSRCDVDGLRGDLVTNRSDTLAYPTFASTRGILCVAIALGFAAVQQHLTGLCFCCCIRAAAALVALEGRTEVTIEDVGRVIGMCLAHRMRKDVMDGLDNDSKVCATELLVVASVCLCLSVCLSVSVCLYLCISVCLPPPPPSLPAPLFPLTSLYPFIHLSFWLVDSCSVSCDAQVQSMFRRVADPEVREREEAAAKAREEAEAKIKEDQAAGDKRAGKKAGAWGGL